MEAPPRPIHRGTEEGRAESRRPIVLQMDPLRVHAVPERRFKPQTPIEKVHAEDTLHTSCKRRRTDDGRRRDRRRSQQLISCPTGTELRGSEIILIA